MRVKTDVFIQGLDTLINTLRDPAKELKLLSAEVIANISKIRKARRAMRKGDGISRLVRKIPFPYILQDIAIAPTPNRERTVFTVG
jgi:hypothetical protein